jgi:fimbrial chaperone protein
MNTQKLLALKALVGCVLAAAGAAEAGIFSVTPVRIYMTPRDRAVAITLTNEGDSEVALQADISAWSQTADGTDELALTEDMILSPPIIRLAPRARQVVRLALLKPADASRQLTYRMVIREVPEIAAAKDNTLQVPIALALSMPVFITPPVAKREVTCEGVRETQSIQAVCANVGTAYAQVREINLKRGDALLARFEGGNYVLPGARKTIPLTASELISAGAAVMNVMFDDGKVQVFNITVP